MCNLHQQVRIPASLQQTHMASVSAVHFASCPSPPPLLIKQRCQKTNKQTNKQTDELSPAPICQAVHSALQVIPTRRQSVTDSELACIVSKFEQNVGGSGNSCLPRHCLSKLHMQHPSCFLTSKQRHSRRGACSRPV